jgi:thymidylate kinase
MILFESVDKAGKTTIIKTLHDLTNHQYVLIDRFTGSNIVYGIFHKRNIDVQKLLDLEKELCMTESILPVYLIANKKVIANRIKKHHEKDIRIEDIDMIFHIYKKYLIKSPFNYFCLDTTSKTPEECAVLILNELKWREENEKR